MHDLQVWEISSGFPSLSAHVLVHEGDDCHAIGRELEQMLKDTFEIEHTTLQVDHAAPTADLRSRPHTDGTWQPMRLADFLRWRSAFLNRSHGSACGKASVTLREHARRRLVCGADTQGRYIVEMFWITSRCKHRQSR